MLAYMTSITRRLDRFTWLGVLLLTAILVGWLYFSPPGLLGKADAVGYAVCHRITVRTFMFGERQLPLCARCSGMYLGALAGILYQVRLGRKGGFPPKKILAVLGVLLIIFGIDGVNSYFHLLPGFPVLYDPSNFLRLVTGTGMGIGMAVVLMPILHQTFWQTWDPEPAVRRFRDLALLLVIALAFSGLLLTENPLLLYPLALLSAGTVILILGLIYSIVWIMIRKKENAFTHISQLTGYLSFGFFTALAQIFLIDLARLWVTGTWNGFNF
jgi:uncharacterized membrane protein